MTTPRVVSIAHVLFLCLVTLLSCDSDVGPGEDPRPEASFSADPLKGPAPLVVTFTNRSRGFTTEQLWDFGDGTTSDERNPAHTYTQPGSYDVSLSVSNSSGTDSKSISHYVEVVSVPVASFSATPRQGERPLAVSFTDKSTGDIDKWEWNFGDNGTSTQQSPSHLYEDAGLYPVTLTVRGPAGSSTYRIQNYISVGLRTQEYDNVVSSTTRGPYWFDQGHTRGDCDFTGHGPTYSVDVLLKKTINDTRLTCVIDIELTETRSDYTTAYVHKEVTVYTAPSGWRIFDVLTPTHDTYDETNPDDYHGHLDFNTAVCRFSLVADTSGDDVCNDNGDQDCNFTFSMNRVDIVLIEIP